MYYTDTVSGGHPIRSDRTMAYHLACYESQYDGRKAQSAKSKYESTCQICMGRIKVGDSFTWTRNGAEAPAPATPNAMQPPVATSATGALIDIAGLATALIPHLEGRFAASVEAPVMRTIEVKRVDSDAPAIDVGMQHKQFPKLLSAVSAGVNVWLAGPSGSGKTTAAQAVAKGLSLAFYYCGAIGDAFGLLGYMNAEGKLVRTPFREAYEHGGVFLFDEVDASDANALLAFNAALANGHAAFPDGIVARHPDCKIIAAANTWGHGANHEYVGRNKLDMAFLKRFAFLSWDYDSDLETATAPNLAWTKRVQEIRAKVVAKGLRVLVTPRESYIGAALLAVGLDQVTVEEMTIKSGMTDDQWRQVM